MNELEEMLRTAMQNGATHQVRYSDYDENQWTVPVLLTDERIDRIINDLSVIEIRIILTIAVN